MTFLHEFSYPDVSQRRMMLFNSIISFILLGFIFISASIELNYYFIYQPVLQIVCLSALAGIFAGNLIGKLIFVKFKKYRLIYICADVLFILSSLFYLYSKFVIHGNSNPLLFLFFKNPYYLLLPSLLISLFAGIKINYFLKIFCGDFIDNEIPVTSFLLFALIGIALGIVLAILLYYYKNLYYYSGILLLFILPTIFLIKLSYNPTPIYAQEVKENNSESVKIETNYKRDDLFFIYLNFTYILIYLVLGFTSIVKYFGGFFYIKIFFIIISFLSIAAGFIFGRMVKQVFWYIYAEMLYPVFFLISLVSLIYFKDRISFPQAICIFIPTSIISGFSLSRTISHILSSNNHKNRFNIIDFSIFILPPPILISLYFVDFTYFWYFILLYAVMLLNIFIPGVYLMQEKIKGYKKLLFFMFTLVFIPLLILMHMYFNIPLNNNLYIIRTHGFDSLNSINYNSRYINNAETVYIDGIESFRIDDPIIRNMERSIAPVILYANNNWNEVLLIDGNRKFFKNPVISLLKNVNCLDYVPERIVDFKTLPITGDQNYVLEQSDILYYLAKRRSPFKMIVDIPNLFDQALNAFRFSTEYYNIINNYLTSEGIFVQILALNCRNDFIVNAAKNLKASYKKTIGFYFPDYLVLMSSNNSDALKINSNSINNLKEILDTKTELKNIFYNELHLLSHILFLKIDDLIVYMNNEEIDPFYFLYSRKNFRIDKNLVAAYIDNNSYFVDIIDKNNSNIFFLNMMQNQLSMNKFFLAEIKKEELYEINKEYENESAQLISLRRQAEYKSDLRKYISDILSYKEDYYYDAALRFEKEKKWEDARKLYRAILIINKNNFEANLNLGNLCIILQDLNSSFEYLQYAMILKKDNPKVFFQMGVLLFSSGRPREALVYLERSLELKEKSALLFYYIGLCYEALDNSTAAINYYNQAMILDPNDKNVISGIERIKEQNNLKRNELKPEEQSSHTEVEQGEDIPLTISEKAINVRIEEDKSESPKPQKEKN